MDRLLLPGGGGPGAAGGGVAGTLVALTPIMAVPPPGTVGSGPPAPLPRRYVRCVALSSCCLLLVLLAYLPALRAPPPRQEPQHAVIAGWARNRSRDLRLYVMPDNATTLLQPKWAPCPPAHPPPASPTGPPPAPAASLLPGAADPPAPPFLLVVVCSALDHADARATIRETWGSVRSVEGMAVRVAFLVGTPPPPPPLPPPPSSDEEEEEDGGEEAVAAAERARTAAEAKHREAAIRAARTQGALEAEAAQFGDIIQERFVDSYNNLTLKTVFLLKWARSKCPSAAFLMKTDDDMFVNVRSLVALLLAIQRQRSKGPLAGGVGGAGAGGGSSTGPPSLPGAPGRPPLSPGPVLLGALICGARPITNASNKWFAPKYMYNGRMYPNYLSGTGYVMSGDALPPLYNAALRTPFFHLEDVFLTGLCARRAGLRPRDHPAFTYAKRPTDACMLRGPSVVTSHHMERTQLRVLWAQINNKHLNCTAAATTKAQTSQKPSVRPLGRKGTGVRRPGYRCV